MVIPQLIIGSLKRRHTKVLTALVALMLSSCLLFSLMHIKNSVSESLLNFTGQIDLIVGAPAQPSHLALYGLFRIGHAPPAIAFDVYQQLQAHPEVALAIPLRVMESHRGYPVTATTGAFIESLTQQESVVFAHGSGFKRPYHLVLGARVATKTGYQVGEQMTIAQGMEPTIYDEYAHPFTISGILAPTGGALDDGIFVQLDDVLAIRTSLQRSGTSPETNGHAINLVLLQLYDRQALFPLENQFKSLLTEPVEVAIPDRELNVFKKMGDQAANLLLCMVTFTMIIAFVSVFFSVSGSLSERLYELETLRMLGARGHQIIAIGLAEPLSVIALASVGGFILFKTVFMAVALWAPLHWMSWLVSFDTYWQDIALLLGIIIAGALPASWLAWKTYGQLQTSANQ